MNASSAPRPASRAGHVAAGHDPLGRGANASGSCARHQRIFGAWLTIGGQPRRPRQPVAELALERRDVRRRSAGRATSRTASTGGSPRRCRARPAICPLTPIAATPRRRRADAVGDRAARPRRSPPGPGRRGPGRASAAACRAPPPRRRAVRAVEHAAVPVVPRSTPTRSSLMRRVARVRHHFRPAGARDDQHREALLLDRLVVVAGVARVDGEEHERLVADVDGPVRPAARHVVHGAGRIGSTACARPRWPSPADPRRASVR